MADKKLMVVIGADTSGFTKAMDSVKNTTKSATDSVKKGFDGLGGSGEQSAGKIKSAFGSVAKVIATAFAVDKIVGFGKSVVEQAASAQAMEAQFAQVFGGMQNEATSMINSMSGQFNMLPNRVKPVFTSLSSMFMGVGMDSEMAMKTAEQATMASADAAAFYDTSMESASSSIQSFLKGNYEAGEAVGIFANDAQMANFAIQQGLVGTTAEWRNLDEATKMAVRAEYIRNMQEQSGAMGQASREGSNYENVMGNLAQAWADFQAALGKNLLPAVAGVIEKLTQGLQNVNVDTILNGFSAFGSYLKDVFTPVFETVKEVVQIVWEAFKDAGGIEFAQEALDKVKEALNFVRDNAEQLVPILAGLLGAFVAFKTISAVASAINAVKNAFTLLKTATSLANVAQLIFNGTLLANPFTWVAIAIGVLIAAIVAIWQNWDSISQFLSNSWEAIKELASTVFTAIGDFFTAFWEGTKEVFNASMEFIKNLLQAGWDLIKLVISAALEGIKIYIQTIWEVIKTIITTVMDLIKAVITTAWNIIKTIITGVVEGIKFVITSVWNGIQVIITTVLNVIQTVISTVWNAIKTVISTILNGIMAVITTIWNGIKATITTVINLIKIAIQSGFEGIKIITQTIFNLIKSVITTVWNGIKTTITTVVNGIRAAISSVWNGIKSITSGVFNSIKSTASSVWNGIKNAITSPIEAAKNKVQGIVSAIKGFFSGMKLRIPKISMPPLPHFTISGGFSLKPPSVPKIGISWYETGGIATGASIVGIGENGDEAILPLSNKKRMKPFASAVASMMNDENDGSGGGNITNNFNIASLVVREEADIQKISKELYKLQQKDKFIKGRL